jgi:Ras family
LELLKCTQNHKTRDGSPYETTEDCDCWKPLRWSVHALTFRINREATTTSSNNPDFSAGKSSLTVQYCEGHFVESYYPTIENTFSHEILYKGQKFATEIIDTAGQVDDQSLPEALVLMMLQDEYSILNSKHFIGIHGYMIVYSVGSRQSFEMVRNIMEKILNHLASMRADFSKHWTNTLMSGSRRSTYNDRWKQERH